MAWPKKCFRTQKEKKKNEEVLVAALTLDQRLLRKLVSPNYIRVRRALKRPPGSAPHGSKSTSLQGLWGLTEQRGPGMEEWGLEKSQGRVL